MTSPRRPGRTWACLGLARPRPSRDPSFSTWMAGRLREAAARLRPRSRPLAGLGSRVEPGHRSRPQPRPSVGGSGDRLPPGLSPGPARWVRSPDRARSLPAGGRCSPSPHDVYPSWALAELDLRAWPHLGGRINRPDFPSYSFRLPRRKSIVCSNLRNIYLPSPPTPSLFTQFSSLQKKKNSSLA